MVEEIGVAIHGSTGSIGTQTLDVIKRLRGKLDYKVEVLVCHKRIEILEPQILEFRPRYAVVVNEEKAEELGKRLKGKSDTQILGGEKNGNEACSYPEVGTVVVATEGFAGLAPTLEAIGKGKRIATANKETFLTAGKLVMDAVNKHGVEILPIDSEPSAMWQSLEPEVRMASDTSSAIWKLRHGGEHQIDYFMLTGSGGKFRDRPRHELGNVTPKEAVMHPNWDMGPLVTVRSNTMMNKGMERIEAAAIFGVPVDMVRIVQHPQSVVHSGVAMLDGTMKVQQGEHDMRYPILYSLAFPRRIDIGLPRFNLAKASRFDFKEPDMDQFPALRIADRAARLGGTAPAALNGADETAVDLFSEGKINFLEMTDLTGMVVERHSKTNFMKNPELSDILNIDAWARKEMASLVEERSASRAR